MVWTQFFLMLTVSRANEDDANFVLSVGGGDAENNVSPNIVSALDKAKKRGLKIFRIVGRAGATQRKWGIMFLHIPTVDADNITPHAPRLFKPLSGIVLFPIPKLQCTTGKMGKPCKGCSKGLDETSRFSRSGWCPQSC